MDRIKLNLNEDQLAILRSEFKEVKGILKLTRNNAIGKFITSQVQWSKEPVYNPEKGIYLGLPKFEFISQQNLHPYISVQCQQNISDFLQANFEINIELFFIKGYRQGFKQKDIINAFLYHYKLPWSITTFERLKQKDFRKRKNVKKIIADYIVNY